MATSPANVQSFYVVKRPNAFAVAWKVIVKKPSRVIGLILIAIFVLMAAIGPMLYPPVLPIDPLAIYAAPSFAHPLGTDFQGTDVLAEIITGARFVLLGAFFAALFAVLIGTSVGLVAGYFRKWRDSVLMRITDLFLTVPSFPLLIVLSTIWRFTSPLALGLVLGITGWAGLARAVRSQTFSLRERGFIEAARGIGLSDWHLLTREIFPNIAPYIVMNLLIATTGAIYSEIGLFFLGIVPFSTNNWGVMLNMAFTQSGAMYTKSGLLYLLSPLACIMLVTFGVVLFLDAVDELLNPRLKGV